MSVVLTDAEVNAIVRLSGCSCCTDSDAWLALYPDGCPIEDDGYVDHEYGDACLWGGDGKGSAIRFALDAIADRQPDLLRRAYEAGYGQGLAGVWYADTTTPFHDYMYDQWLATQTLSAPV